MSNVDSTGQRSRATRRSCAVLGALACLSALPSLAHEPCVASGCAGTPYDGMPEVAPIGVRVDKYMDVPAGAKGPAIDASKGYRLQQVGDGLHVVTDNVYQAMLMVHDQGVIVVDAPPSLAAYLPKAIREVTDKPITHLVYSHAHIDHIGGAASLGADHPVIIAHQETRRLLERANDPNRPLPSVTFQYDYTLSVGGQQLKLSYHGNGHQPGNIFIHAPRQRTLMVVDVVFPGWMPWRRLALAQDVPGYFTQVEEIAAFDFDVLVSGHVARTGTRQDVLTQLAFMRDLKAAAGNALNNTTPGAGLNATDQGNPWAVFDHYIDRVALACVNQLAPQWSRKLAAFDVYIWDQCLTMEQSLRLD